MSIVFNSSPTPTLGVGSELQVVDTATLDQDPATSEVPAELRHPGHFKHELFESTIEINSGIYDTVTETRHDLQAALNALNDVVEPHGWALLSPGTPPSAEHQVVSTHPNRGRPLPMVSPWIKTTWRAARFGLGADPVATDDGSLEPLPTSIREFVEQLMRAARELSCEAELSDVDTVIEAGASYARRRGVFDRTESLWEVVALLVDEPRIDTFTPMVAT